jgi:hypothetical protein
MSKTFRFHVNFQSEPSAGLPGFTEDIAVEVHSGDLGDRDDEFVEYMRGAIAEWYDGAAVSTPGDIERYEDLLDQDEEQAP